MATYRLGAFYDVHHPKNNATYPNDASYLMNDLGCDALVFGGDQINGDDNATPHSPASDLRGFWDNIDGALSASQMDNTYAIPGNHDIPVRHHEQIASEYIDDRGTTPQSLQPVDGLTILLIDTQGPSRTQGGKKGVGQAREYIPWRQLEWTRQEIQAAHSRGDVILILGHAPVLFGNNANLLSYNGDGPYSSEADYVNDAYRHDSAAYELVENFADVHVHWSRNSPVVYLSGHDNHNADLNGSAELYENQAGIYHIWQDHYGTGTNAPHTFGYLDVDTGTGNVKYVSVDSGTKSTTTVMDVTPTW